MSNRGVRGVRVVGPGSRPSGGQASEPSTEPGADTGFDPAEAAALASLDVAAEESTSAPAEGPESDAIDHIETAAAGGEPAQKVARIGRRTPRRPRFPRPRKHHDDEPVSDRSILQYDLVDWFLHSGVLLSPGLRHQVPMARLLHRN